MVGRALAPMFLHPLQYGEENLESAYSAKWDYITNLAKDLSENLNPKPFWNYVKSKHKGANVLTSLEVNGKNITDDFGTAESMNQFFSSVFTSENMDNFPEFDYVCDQKLSDIQCSTTEVENHLKVLDIYKSPGPDNISPRVLRECALESAPSLCILLKKSFSTGQLPVGRLLILPHYIRKEASIPEIIVDRFHLHQ